MLAAGASAELSQKFAEYRTVRAELAHLTMIPVGVDPTGVKRRTG